MRFRPFDARQPFHSGLSVAALSVCSVCPERSPSPIRIVWGEFYLYDSQGRYVGWADGDLGVQLYSSTFRLHFGHFVGMWLQVAYIVLGVALCMV